MKTYEIFRLKHGSYPVKVKNEGFGLHRYKEVVTGIERAMLTNMKSGTDDIFIEPFSDLIESIVLKKEMLGEIFYEHISHLLFEFQGTLHESYILGNPDLAIK